MISKYPRTLHLPWSPGATNDDRRMKDVRDLVGVEVIVTEKLDGSQVCMTHDALFARSHSGPPTHPSFDWLKAFHAAIRHGIYKDYEVYGEYCYAVHSIRYQALPTYFFVFGIRSRMLRRWIGWDGVEYFSERFGLQTVPVCRRGKTYSEQDLKDWTAAESQLRSRFGPEKEGVVLRTNAEFEDALFERRIGKWVRAGHVQTDEHWSDRPIEKQPLLEK